MNPDRQASYEQLEDKVGNTPLITIPAGSNTIYAKREDHNPTQSHYDRVYVPLLRALEETSDIHPNQHTLVEVSSGSAGASFAWACQQLGYRAIVFLPKILPKERVADVAQYGADIMLTEGYVKEAGEHMQAFLKAKNKDVPKDKRTFWSPNHSRDKRSTTALGSMMEEVLAATPIDIYVAALGNGTSVLGPGRVLKEANPDARIIAWEPAVSGIGYELFHKRKKLKREHQANGLLKKIYKAINSLSSPYTKQFGFSPGSVQHAIYGTGVADVDFPFLFDAIVTESVVDDVILVKDAATKELLQRIWHRYIGNRAPCLAPGGSDTANLIVYQETVDFVNSLPDIQNGKEKVLEHSVGTSSAGSLEVALRLAQTMENKKMLVVFYDAARKYASHEIL